MTTTFYTLSTQGIKITGNEIWQYPTLKTNELIYRGFES